MTGSVVAGLRGRRWVLWSAFLIVHVALGLIFLQGAASGDVQNFYLAWFHDASDYHVIVGIDRKWVYPLLAWLPIAAAGLAAGSGSGSGPIGFELTWLVLVILVDSAAFAVLTARMTRNRVIAAWWWTVALAALGPVVVGRLDTVASALAVAAVVVIQLRPRLAGVLLAVATGVKVWPAALILAFVVGSKRRISILLAVVTTTVVVVILGVVLGGSPYLFSFVTAQSGRGIQVEAPLATPWLWAAASGVRGIETYFNTTISTDQVAGPGVDIAANLSSPVLAAATLVIILVGVRAVIRRADASRTVAALALALTAAIIVFNKVGSPQYQMWYFPVVVFGLLISPRWFRTPAILILAAALLTQVIYPYFYTSLLMVQPWMLCIITTRNLLGFAILGWALIALWRAPRAISPHDDAEILRATTG